MTLPALGPALLAPGAVLRDRYEIRRELGRGGYSIVYQAHDREVGDDVAVKLLVPPPASAHLARERLRREVHAVRALSHGNIVAVYDLLDEGPWSFIVMEYVDGPDLAVRVRQRGPLSAEETVALGRDIAAALDAAHRRGILHRDVKPQNILLDPAGRARLTDFGSAKLDGQLGITATGALAGTLAYAAPEIVAGRRGDARADVYALGLTLYFALTGLLPGRSGHGPTEVAPEGHHPAQDRPGVPAWLDQVVARATAGRTESRYPTVAALGEALAAADPRAGAPAGAARCVLCGGGDPLGLGLCPGCGGAPGALADTLVFLRRPRGRTERRAFEARLAILLPAVEERETRAAARGERPLFRATPGGAERTIEALEGQQLPARAVPDSRAWTTVPASFGVMVGSVAVAGVAAGITASPLLLWATPLMSGLLLVGAYQAVRRPVMGPGGRRVELPPAVEAAVVRTLADLPDGPARRILADVAGLAQDLFGRLKRSGDPHRVTHGLTELVSSASAAAADLAALDQHLERFEQQRARSARLADGWLDALARSERARDALVQRLLEAMAVLGRLQSQALHDVTDEDATLADATRELRVEAEAQAAAAREIEELLAV